MDREAIDREETDREEIGRQAMSARGERFVAEIRRDGAELSPELARAFAMVPRELFVADGFQRRDGGWAVPADDDFLDLVYADDVLVTKLDDKTPVSSSSQPSLMAGMIAALDLRPGLRVLEIGAGTGYNAALLSALGAQVTSVDVQADVADRARTALRRAGVESARVVLGDGYAGVPDQRFDRVIVTVGVAGLSPYWLESLEGPGPLVVPVEHAGTQPVLTARREPNPAANPRRGSDPASKAAREHEPATEVRRAHEPATEVRRAHEPATEVRRALDPPTEVRRALDPAAGQEFTVTASVLCPAGFMSAAGPLTADHPGAHPAPAGARTLADFSLVAGSRWTSPLPVPAYRDLWYAAGVWSRRATHAAIRGREQSALALLDDARTGGAVVLPDGSVLAGGKESARFAAEAAAIVDRWESAGRPPMRAWRIGLTLTGDPATPIWVPTDWQL